MGEISVLDKIIFEKSKKRNDENQLILHEFPSK